MAKKKILITGGTGFVGHHLVEALLGQNDDQFEIHLTTTDRQRPFFWTEAIGGIDHLHQLDLAAADQVTALIKQLQPAEIYHLASLAQVGNSFDQARHVLENNFALQLNLLEAVAAHCPTAKLLVISSAAIYDVAQNPHPPLVDENCPLGPNNPYAASKAIQDLMSTAYARSHQLQLICARPFNHIGDYQGLGFAVPDFTKQIIEAKHAGGGVIKVGDLSPQRDFTDVKDVVAAYILLMAKGEIGQVYNVGTGRSLSMQEILDQLLALTGTQNLITVETDPQLLRPVDIPNIVADNSRLTALGWQPEIPLAATLDRIINYWENQLFPTN